MKYGKNVRQALVVITQFGIDMIVPITLCSIAGYYLDRHFGTSWIFVAMFFFGAVCGAWNVFRFARRIYSSESGDVRNRDLAQPSCDDTADHDAGGYDADEYDAEDHDAAYRQVTGSVGKPDLSDTEDYEQAF